MALKQEKRAFDPFPMLTRYCPYTPEAKQAVFLMLPHREAFFGGATGGGKLLDIRSMIPTPRGFVPLADIHPGDPIIGRDGRAHTVLAESPVVVAPAYRLVFDDGAEIVANDDHLWPTYTAAERAALHRRDPAWRARRRATRPSRAAGRKSARFTTSLTARNSANPPACAPAPTGAARTTAEIVATLRLADGRTNHAIPVAEPLHLPDRALPLDPYVLGVWLGDGTSNSGQITTADPEIADAVAAAGFPVRRVARKPDNKAATYTHEGLYAALKAMTLLGNKHIPRDYLWASAAQRLQLLRGLLDTDGGVEEGAPTFTNTRRALVEGVAHLARSLGHKATVREGVARLHGRAIGPKWTTTFSTTMPVCALPRKADRIHTTARRPTTRFRYIVSAERIPPVAMKCLRVSSPDHLYLVGEHLIPTHNSIALLMAALMFVDVADYNALLLRQTYTQLAQPGALIDIAHEWFTPTDARWSEEKKRWAFPSGATISFGHMQHETSKFDYQGGQWHFIAFDELGQFTKSKYTYMFSRLRKRSDSPVPVRIRGAGNPGGIGHEWIKERFVTAPKADNRPFIPATLDDNPHLDRAGYLAMLDEMDPVTRAQYRYGDWDVAEAGDYFDPAQFEIVNAPPL